MKMTVIEILLGIGAFLGASAAGFLSWQYKRMLSKVDTHGERLTRVEDSYVNDEKVRIIFNECVKPLIAQYDSIRTELTANTQAMHTMMLELAKKEGYEQGQRDLKRGTNGSD